MPADFGSLALAGSGLGCAGFTVLDDSTSILQVAQAVARFPTWSAASARPASTGLAWPRARSTRSSMRRGEPRPLGTRAHCGLRRTPGKPVLPTGPGLDPHPEPAEIVQGGIREPDREPRVRLPWSGRSARSLTPTGRPGPSATIRTSAIGGRTGPTASSPRRVIPRASGLSRRPLRETAMAVRVDYNLGLAVDEAPTDCSLDALRQCLHVTPKDFRKLPDSVPRPPSLTLFSQACTFQTCEDACSCAR